VVLHTETVGLRTGSEDLPEVIPYRTASAPRKETSVDKAAIFVATTVRVIVVASAIEVEWAIVAIVVASATAVVLAIVVVSGTVVALAIVAIAVALVIVEALATAVVSVIVEAPAIAVV
ncbi:MAG TPA: hypothetical protein VM656_14600, partial [Pyrinomonadaceae bacterium]|nr:hypothetical protein [Pyrinomonadaceae bacterium]